MSLEQHKVIGHETTAAVSGLSLTLTLEGQVGLFVPDKLGLHYRKIHSYKQNKQKYIQENVYLIWRATSSAGLFYSFK